MPDKLQQIGRLAMSQRCPVCRGRQKIDLPLYQEVAVSDRSSMAMSETISLDEMRKTFPCPECAPTVPENRVAILRHGCEVDARIGKEIIPHARERAAAALADAMLASGFIKFEDRGHLDQGRLTTPMRATIGVVAPSHVADMQTRIEENQEAFARVVISEAEKHIQNWGSHYGQKSISKSMAIDEMRKALQTVSAACKGKKP